MSQQHVRPYGYKSTFADSEDAAGDGGARCLDGNRIDRMSAEALLPASWKLTGDGAVARLLVAADEPVFQGHYPDFPILPGVLLIDQAHRCALWYAAQRLPGRAELTEVRSVRFHAPVFPGDELETICAVTRKADERVTVVARCTTARGVAATMTLGYRLIPE